MVGLVLLTTSDPWRHPDSCFLSRSDLESLRWFKKKIHGGTSNYLEVAFAEHFGESGVCLLDVFGPPGPKQDTPDWELWAMDGSPNSQGGFHASKRSRTCLRFVQPSFTWENANLLALRPPPSVASSELLSKAALTRSAVTPISRPWHSTFHAAGQLANSIEIRSVPVLLVRVLP